ncbi:unnamed protein product, partial [Polarella glacialis]
AGSSARLEDAAGTSRLMWLEVRPDLAESFEVRMPPCVPRSSRPAAQSWQPDVAPSPELLEAGQRLALRLSEERPSLGLLLQRLLRARSGDGAEQSTAAASFASRSAPASTAGQLPPRGCVLSALLLPSATSRRPSHLRASSDASIEETSSAIGAGRLSRALRRQGLRPVISELATAPDVAVLLDLGEDSPGAAGLGPVPVAFVIDDEDSHMRCSKDQDKGVGPLLPDAALRSYLLASEGWMVARLSARDVAATLGASKSDGGLHPDKPFAPEPEASVAASGVGPLLSLLRSVIKRYNAQGN